MKKTVIALALAASLGASGCSSTQPIIPAKAIALTANTSIAYSTLAIWAAVALAVHVWYDPLAPNWEVEEAQLPGNTYRFSMTMKRYHTGGAGESFQILKRRASQLQYQQGFGAYEILEYTEGIDSETLGARRVAQGVVRLVQRQEADSFGLNEVR